MLSSLSQFLYSDAGRIINTVSIQANPSLPPPRSHSCFSGVSDATIYTLTCFLCNRCLSRGAEFRERRDRDRVHIETYVLLSVFSGHLRQGYCTVSHDNFIYFIGGGERYPNMSSVIRIVSNVDRYDLHANQ